MGPFGKKELLHLLRRTLFGVRISDLKQLNGKSLISVIDLLLMDPPPDAGPLKTYFTVSNNVKTDNLDTTVPMGTSWANIPIPIGANPNTISTSSLLRILPNLYTLLIPRAGA